MPYSIFYMSCNLDHVLHNKRNSTKEEKQEDSVVFATAANGYRYEHFTLASIDEVPAPEFTFEN